VAPSTVRVGSFTRKVGYKYQQVGPLYQQTWYQLPEQLARITTRGMLRNQKNEYGGGKNVTKFFLTSGFLITTASTICPEKTPQVWTSPLT
jgi:hypothetical protein